MRDKILELLRQNPQEISGEDLSKQLNISRAAVAKHIKTLRQNGYQIEATPHIGYKFITAPDKLLAAEIKHYLPTDTPWKIIYKEEVDSTNNLLRQKAQENTPDFTALIAEKQTAGKGRLGRNWQSPPQTGIWLSVLWHPPIAPSQAQFFTLTTAVAINETLCNLGYASSIKWPNDILFENKKICGILAEMQADMDTLHWVIMGIGINCYSQNIPPDLQNIATGIDINFPRAKLCAKILENLQKYYFQLCNHGFAPIREKWLQNSNCIGKKITANTMNGSFSGIATDIDENGYLIMELDDGTRKKIITGDIINN